ncbi:MAG: PAS domain S-box protein [Desulfobulbaceae bacterium]|nr:PAS domain S-box protein [Desulfobulbaceae bacterium]
MENQTKPLSELRQRVEKLVRSNNGKPLNITSMSPEEIQQMLHELQVHQIELEIQNEELHRAQDGLDAARIRYFELYDLAPVGYLTLCNNGRIKEANLTAGTLLCSAKERLVNKLLTQFIHTEDQDLYYLYRKQNFEIGTPNECELRLVKQDGTIFWAHLTATALPQQTGITEFRVVLNDITDRKWAEEQLKAAKENLERRVEQRTLELQEAQAKYLHSEKLAALGKLSGSIAHEINNPLLGIQFFLNGLQERALLKDEDKTLLAEAISECRRVKDLMRNLREFDRPGSSRKALMDLHQALDSILLLQKTLFSELNIKLVRDFAVQLPKIMVVPTQIKQVLINLLINATDACQQHSGIIKISTRQEGDRVAVAIKDNGIGIKPEAIESIFQPFYSTKPDVIGTGLGLSVSYGIIKQHQGEIQVKSQPGKGATFTVSLPITG